MPEPSSGDLTPTRLRFDALDVVRGIAVLGILLMNIEEMGTPKAAWGYPPLISWTGADQAVWWLRDVFAKGTMRGLLSLLFGAGFILMTTRAGRDDGKVADAYHRRNIWLVLFGLVHGYLILWPGDILLIYGAVGLFLFPWRHWAPQRLLKAGVVVVVAMTLLAAGQYWRNVQASRQAAAARARLQTGATLLTAERDALTKWEKREAAWRPNVEEIKKDTEARLGGLASNWQWQVEWANELNAPVGLFYWLLDAIALMFIGAALVKWGKVLRPFAAVGRLALSNYIFQTLVCQWLLFPGFGLGLFGRFGLARLWLIVLGINVVQILGSLLYLRRYQMGPLESVLRRLSY